MSQKTRIHTFISGLVQGVFFRAGTAQKAKELGLFGWVRNTQDNRVEAVFEGAEEKIKEMTAWLKKGPTGAKVQDIDAEKQNFTGEFKDFKIKL